MSRLVGRRRIACLYFNSIPSPYVVGRFNALTDALGRDQFLAVFEQVREPDRDWTVAPSDWRFDAVILPRGGLARQVRLVRLLLQVRPRVVITLYNRSVFLLFAVAARLLGARVVFRVLATHEAWIARSWRRELLKKLAFRFLARGCKTSGPDGEAYAREYGGPRLRVWHVTQGIDLDRFRVPPAREPGAVRRFVYVGRMIPEKDVEGLVTAFADVLASGRQAELHLVGTGPEVQRLGPRPGVTWHGHVEGEDLTRLYQQADVFVFPTLGDPYGLALTEAMACGCAVITTTAIGERHDRVVVPETGLLVTPGRSDELAAAMTRYCDDPDLLARHRRNAAAHAVDHSYSAYANDVVALLQDLGVPAG